MLLFIISSLLFLAAASPTMNNNLPVLEDNLIALDDNLDEFEDNRRFIKCDVTEEGPRSSMNSKAASKWPEENGFPLIRFAITSQSMADAKVIRDGTKVLNDRTCVKFQEVPEGFTKYHLRYVKQGEACGSLNGFVNGSSGSQHITIGKGCESIGTVIHETMHTLGASHTHARPDRDKYVRIIWENVAAGKTHNFNKKTNFLTHDVPYDYLSIMHYTINTFSKKDWYPVLVTIPDTTNEDRLANHWQLTHYDALLVNKHYGCLDKWKKACSSTKVCKNDGYLGKDCKCICRHGTEGDECEKVTGPYYPPLKNMWYITKSGVNISNPGYPGKHYERLQQAKWGIKAPEGKVPRVTVKQSYTIWKFNGKCVYEHFKVRRKADLWTEEIFCDKDLKNNRAFYGCNPDGILTIAWKSGAPGMATGFTATVEFVPRSECPTTTT